MITIGKGMETKEDQTALLIKPTEKTFAEVLSQIYYKINPYDSKAEVASIRKTKDGGALIELDPRTTNKGTFCEAVKKLLGKKALASEWKLLINR